ncbi:hypothetical protein [Streptomyces sp. NPDC054794]
MTVLNCLMRVTVPDRGIRQVMGVDEFTLHRGHHFASIVIDAETGERSWFCATARTPRSPPGCANTLRSGWCVGTGLLVSPS